MLFLVQWQWLFLILVAVDVAVDIWANLLAMFLLLIELLVVVVASVNQMISLFESIYVVSVFLLISCICLWMRNIEIERLIWIIWKQNIDINILLNLQFIRLFHVFHIKEDIQRIRELGIDWNCFQNQSKRNGFKSNMILTWRINHTRI